MLQRVIPILLVENGRLIKTARFDNPKYIGDLLNTVKIYNELEIDELCILDRSARKNGINFELISKFVNECFSPVSYGGGIDTIAQIEKILSLGAEKVILCTALLNFEFVQKAVDTFGSSTISACIDYRVQSDQRFVFIENGVLEVGVALPSFIIDIVGLGVGEILIQNIDRDGTYSGYDLDLLEDLAHKVKNPIVVLGGCDNLTSIKKAIELGASGAAAGSLFVYYTNAKGILINYPDHEEFLSEGIKR